MHARVVTPLGGYDVDITQTRTLRRLPSNIAWREALPAAYQSLVDELSWAMLEEPDEWHTIYMQLAGALLSSRVPPELVPTIVRHVSLATGRDEPQKRDERVSEARSTVERFLRGQRIQGYGALPEKVRIAFDRGLSPPAARAVREAAPGLSAIETTRRIEDVIAHAGPGVTVVEAPCGMGKTQSVIRVATTRGTEGWKVRRTGILVPTHRLAEQIYTQLGPKLALRMFSPTKHKTDGKPTCQYHETATALASGGQDIRWELCKGRDKRPCPHLLTCVASIGFEGNENAPIVIGVHPKASEVSERIGKAGLLFVDEPPTSLDRVSLTVAQLDAAEAAAEHFAPRYTAVMLPYLRAVRDGETAPPDVSGAFHAKAQRKRPPIANASSFGLLVNPALARTIGAASHVFTTLYRAATDDTPITIRRVGDVTSWTFAPQSLARALAHEGSIVCADATPDYAMLEKVFGGPVIRHSFEVADAAPIERRWLDRTASKTSWFDPSGAPRVEEISRCFLAAFHWASQRPVASLAILTRMDVAKPLSVALGLTVGPSTKLVTALREAVAASGYTGTTLVGWYMAVRGLDNMKDCDGLATVGDPNPPEDEVESDCVYLGEPSGTSARVEWMAQRELEQAHGRLRTVWRSKPGYALHLGRKRPGGLGWVSGFEYVRGVPEVTTLTAEEVTEIANEVGGISALAELVGMSRQAVGAYAAGREKVPVGRVAAFRGTP